MKFRPLHDRVVVRRLEAEEKTAGGIIIPDTAKEKPMEGEVIAVGPGARDEAGKLVAARRQSERPHSVRQVGRHRSEARWRGAPDYGSPTSWASSRASRRQAEGGLISTGQSPERKFGRTLNTAAKDVRLAVMHERACCAAWTSWPTQ